MKITPSDVDYDAIDQILLETRGLCEVGYCIGQSLGSLFILTFFLLVAGMTIWIAVDYSQSFLWIISIAALVAAQMPILYLLLIWMYRPRRILVYSDRIVMHGAFSLRIEIPYTNIWSIEPHARVDEFGMKIRGNPGIRLWGVATDHVHIRRCNGFDIGISPANCDGFLREVHRAMPKRPKEDAHETMPIGMFRDIFT